MMVAIQIALVGPSPGLLRGVSRGLWWGPPLGPGGALQQYGGGPWHTWIFTAIVTRSPLITTSNLEHLINQAKSGGRGHGTTRTKGTRGGATPVAGLRSITSIVKTHRRCRQRGILKVIKTKVKYNQVYDKNTFCSHHQIIGYIAYNNLSFLNDN